MKIFLSFLHAHFEFLCSAPPKICFWLVFPFSFSILIRIAMSSSSYFPFFPSYMGTVCFHSSIYVCVRLCLYVCMGNTTKWKMVRIRFPVRIVCVCAYEIVMYVYAFDYECVFAMVDDGHPGYKYTMPNSYTCMERGLGMYLLT